MKHTNTDGDISGGCRFSGLNFEAFMKTVAHSGVRRVFRSVREAVRAHSPVQVAPASSLFSYVYGCRQEDEYTFGAQSQSS